MTVKISYYAAPTLAAVAMLWAGAALAHHSFALFDMTKPMSIAGTVKQWEWTNPHVWIHIIATKPDGTHEEWGLACSSVTNLMRSGWKSSDLKVGEKITVDMYPSRDGRPFGLVATVLLSDGRVLANPIGPRPGGAHVAANPQAPPQRRRRRSLWQAIAADRESGTPPRGFHQRAISVSDWVLRTDSAPACRPVSSTATQ